MKLLKTDDEKFTDQLSTVIGTSFLIQLFRGHFLIITQMNKCMTEIKEMHTSFYTYTFQTLW